MDYGQKQSTDGSQAFFTAGVGNLAAEKNTYEAENNLDLTNDATSWAPEHDLRNIGNRAIFSPEEIQDSPEIISAKTPDSSPEIVEMVAPPGVDLTEKIETTSPITFNPNLIRTDGEHISRKTISEVNRTIAEFSQTGNAADFYAAIRGDDKNPGMVRNNLKNSYNREVA